MKILNGIQKNRGRNRGMTYVELIVVFTIFSSLSAVVLFNYNAFQSRIDIKNLSNDIALKIADAQKSSISGRIPPGAQGTAYTSNPTLKPSYGVYFNPSEDNEVFTFFTDLDQDSAYDTTTCPGSGECLERISITKGNTIDASSPDYPLSVFYTEDTTPYPLADLTVLFVRPSATAIISSSTSFTSTVNYVQISVLSPKGAAATIRVYPSGKIEIR